METKALMNGKGWNQYIHGPKGSVMLRLKPTTEKNWFEGTVNGNVWFQTRGKKDAVRNFNDLIEEVKKDLGL